MATTASSRRPPNRWGWWIVAGGLSCQVPAAVLIGLFSDIFFLIGLVGVAGVLVGCWILAGKLFWGLPVGMFAGMAMLVGINLGAEQFALDRDYRTATCQVTDVAKDIRTSRSRPTQTWYRLTVRCPDGTHTLHDRLPHSEGGAVEVVYDPRGAEPPTFAGKASKWPFSLIAVAIGAPILLVIPFIAWRRGRRPWTPPPLRTPVGPTPPGAMPPGPVNPTWPGAVPPGPYPGSGPGAVSPGPGPGSGGQAPPEYRPWT
jgi:hypothetical protein